MEEMINESYKDVDFEDLDKNGYFYKVLQNTEYFNSKYKNDLKLQYVYAKIKNHNIEYLNTRRDCKLVKSPIENHRIKKNRKEETLFIEYDGLFLLKPEDSIKLYGDTENYYKMHTDDEIIKNAAEETDKHLIDSLKTRVFTTFGFKFENLAFFSKIEFDFVSL